MGVVDEFHQGYGLQEISEKGDVQAEGVAQWQNSFLRIRTTDQVLEGKELGGDSVTSVCWWKGTERWECMALSGTHGSRTWGQQIIMITFPNYFFFVLQTQVILYLTFVPCELTVKELFMVI